MKIPQSVLDRARSVRLVCFDVDGVLTDGRLLYSDDGREIKAFNVQDGASLKLMMDAGIEVALLTGRTSPMVERRAIELGIRHCHQGLNDKGPALDHLAATLDVPLAETAHVGDDLPDLALFERVGLAISVPNGHPAVMERADYVTQVPGGAGVARELAELFLRARNAWPY
ncbi:MAG: phenylphosphate carboxylase subunit delta [Deltaproteobacteria bacterium]|nr:MAG: phenylphosphate carboxylase subunit delta [Deltaproteobacteria bacterium]